MKLLLADDHTLFRDALVQYIVRSDIDANISVAKDLPDAMQIIEEAPDQDLVILDLRMPGMHGMIGFEEMRQKHPGIPVALMSGVAEPEDVRAAIDLGAVGYFPKTLSGKALLQAIKLVLSGERFVPIDHNANKIMPSYYDDSDGKEKEGAQIPYTGMQETQDKFPVANDFKLTPRECDVLSYLAQGVPNKEIAQALGLQVVTVKLHVRGVCRKLDVKNRTQAALKAQEYGLVKR